MKLRTRILTGFAVVPVLVAGLGVAVVVAQRDQLTDQLDRQLEAAPPDRGEQPPAADPDRPGADPISDIYIAAVLADGTIEVLVQGQLLDDVSDLDELAGASGDGRTFQTVDSVDGSTRFRVLVDNALTHAPGADIEVRATTTSDQLVLVVADDGPGLSDEHASQVFTRFYRGDSARARTVGGSGLGLAIAESIASVHGGTIDLRTAPGEGCEFTVRIPGSRVPVI